MTRISRAILVVAVLMSGFFPMIALAATVNVSANVAGFGNVQIGSIDVQGVGGSTRPTQSTASSPSRRRFLSSTTGTISAGSMSSPG